MSIDIVEGSPTVMCFPPWLLMAFVWLTSFPGEDDATLTTTTTSRWRT